MATTNRVGPTMVRFADTRACGALSIRGFQIEPDADGFIEGPADIAKEIEPHGFIAEDKLTPELREAMMKAWAEARTKFKANQQQSSARR